MVTKATISCPLCDCEITLDGGEKVGEQVYCHYCEAPLKLMKKKDESLYLVEDF